MGLSIAASTTVSSARPPGPASLNYPVFADLAGHRLVGQPLGFAGSAPGGHPTDHFAGTVIGAPFCFTKNTRNLAGFVVLAFRETVCTSSGDS